MVTKALGHERYPHHQQEGKRQHLDARVIGDESTDGFRKDHHQPDRSDHSGDHHRDVADHADRGNDRIQRKHKVNNDNLQNDGRKRRLHCLRFAALLAFK